MASVSATHIILFIASVVVAAGVAGTIVVEVNQLSDAVETRGSGVSDEIATDIQITSDAGYAESIYDGADDEVTVLVKNVGSQSVQAQPSAVDVLVDGRFVQSDDMTVERVDVDDDTWRPGGVVEVTIDVGGDDLEVSGDTRVTVIVNDNEDSIDFPAD
ncbi:flagellin [Natronobacterium gregoryi]|uniref:Archaeal flagellar protein G n=2 Tax=Natronobacterium gregoryi TaxID=44930 RepID=L0AI74_NATGS|nr:flagellin [Natronobacterium gregoryi]AFZ73124.1 putative archaeal flagellar protein G [Natronobacterium gregoryi SP2]ELY70777.1 flagellin [Natronobacterium gregoryi SP2]PLK21538.1 flagellin [Natronobacterium gregoryi SP2]SFI60699.1 flagellar protein FlaG [Natronobacterium gregoryi]